MVNMLIWYVGLLLRDVGVDDGMCASAVGHCFTEVIGSSACSLHKVKLIEPLLIYIGCI